MRSWVDPTSRIVSAAASSINDSTIVYVNTLDSLRHAAIGTRYPQRTLEEWEEAMFKKFGGHEGLRKVREASAAVMSLERDQDVS
jgi:hypothetical protein